MCIRDSNYVKQAVITYAKTFLARASKLKDVALISTDMPESDGDILKEV